MWCVVVIHEQKRAWTADHARSVSPAIGSDQAENDSPQPHVLLAFGFKKLKVSAQHVFLIIQLGALEIDGTLRIDDHFDTIDLMDLIVLSDLVIEINRVAEARTAAPFDAKAKATFLDALYVDQPLDFLSRLRR